MNLSTNDRGGKINEIKVNVDGAGTIGLPHKKKKKKKKEEGELSTHLKQDI